MKANQCHHHLKRMRTCTRLPLRIKKRWHRLKNDQRKLQSRQKGIIENLSDGFSLPVSLSRSPAIALSLVIELIISCQGPWNHTPNPELPFLLASKIFIRTIRSSDKASTEGWGGGGGACGREGRMCQQDVCSATLYTQTTDPSSSIWDPAASPFCPTVRRGSRGKVAPCQPNPPSCPHHHHHHHPKSQQALLCPSPWAGGVGHTARTVGGGGHKGKLTVERANPQKPPAHTGKVSFQTLGAQGHRRTQRVDSRLLVLVIINIAGTSVALQPHPTDFCRFLTYIIFNTCSLWFELNLRSYKFILPATHF